MSKIGRKPINIQGVTVKINEQEVQYKGPKAAGIHILPSSLRATVEKEELHIVPQIDTKKSGSVARYTNAQWGLHRALLANKVMGSLKEFTERVQIIGLGYKAEKNAKGLTFSLGYSHKINFALPQGVAVDVDKTGQLLDVKSTDKELLGSVCSQICALRKTEPYKGTGIKLAREVLIRKDRKTKSA